MSHVSGFVLNGPNVAPSDDFFSMKESTCEVRTHAQSGDS